ncbi:MAG: LysM peptidoglycan-binding domain-containing protein [Myxococcaceae bacterium]|nr:LysM peptidoglycan-binding domain-containing protein [Myxococcaceae bacterium]
MADVKVKNPGAPMGAPNSPAARAPKYTLVKLTDVSADEKVVKVKPGDTADRIAKGNSVPLSVLLKANPGLTTGPGRFPDGRRIYPNDEVRIPNTGWQAKAPAEAPAVSAQETNSAIQQHNNNIVESALGQLEQLPQLDQPKQVLTSQLVTIEAALIHAGEGDPPPTRLDEALQKLKAVKEQLVAKAEARLSEGPSQHEAQVEEAFQHATAEQIKQYTAAFVRNPVAQVKKAATAEPLMQTPGEPLVADELDATKTPAEPVPEDETGKALVKVPSGPPSRETIASIAGAASLAVTDEMAAREQQVSSRIEALKDLQAGVTETDEGNSEESIDDEPAEEPKPQDASTETQPTVAPEASQASVPAAVAPQTTVAPGALTALRPGIIDDLIAEAWLLKHTNELAETDSNLKAVLEKVPPSAREGFKAHFVEGLKQQLRPVLSSVMQDPANQAALNGVRAEFQKLISSGSGALPNVLPNETQQASSVSSPPTAAKSQPPAQTVVPAAPPPAAQPPIPSRPPVQEAPVPLPPSSSYPLPEQQLAIAQNAAVFTRVQQELMLRSGGRQYGGPYYPMGLAGYAAQLVPPYIGGFGFNNGPFNFNATIAIRELEDFFAGLPERTPIDPQTAGVLRQTVGKLLLPRNISTLRGSLNDDLVRRLHVEFPDLVNDAMMKKLQVSPK